MTKKFLGPKSNEFELTLFGPGYGESIVIHIGDGNWVVVDSNLAPNDMPQATDYLKSIGVDPCKSVCLIVATHWHDDHIRGIANILETCTNAEFCCSSYLTRQEFMAVVDALESRHLTTAGSGAREIHRVYKYLEGTDKKLKPALANRRIFSRNACEIWTLSPGDKLHTSFIRSIGSLFPGENEEKSQVRDPSPNEYSVTLWVEIDDIVVLLGADLERKGWNEILQSDERPNRKAFIFKVPHHGSKNADEPRVWHEMLDSNPISVLTPWKRGRGYLPTQSDIRRIVSRSGRAFSTSLPDKILHNAKLNKRTKVVEKTIKESGIKLQRFSTSDSLIRIRRPISSLADWSVECIGRACQLR